MALEDPRMSMAATRALQMRCTFCSTLFSTTNRCTVVSRVCMQHSGIKDAEKTIQRSALCHTSRKRSSFLLSLPPSGVLRLHALAWHSGLKLQVMQLSHTICQIAMDAVCCVPAVYKGFAHCILQGSVPYAGSLT